MATKLQELSDVQNTAQSQPLDNLTDNWSAKVESAPSVMFSKDRKVKLSSFQNFRRLNIFLSDSGPNTDYSNINPTYWIGSFLKNPILGFKNILKQIFGGYSRSLRKTLIEIYDVLKKENALDLLKKYDVTKSAGNPYVFRRKGCSYNARWARHVYFINLIRKHLGSSIKKKNKFVSLDLGGSYGVFSHLFKSEFPNTVQILVEFPDQLLLAAYFLEHSYPQAKIATLLDFKDKKTIDRSFLEKFDFVLIPVTMFDKIEPGSVDMMTNFVSLAEMKRQWFDFYMKSPLFQSIPYFYTCNRFVSGPRFDPTHNSEITILDYPLNEFEPYLFDINPFFTHYYQPKFKFFYQKKAFSSPLFDFLGKRKTLHPVDNSVS